MKLKMKKPDLTKTNHPLPFNALSPEQFETLCLWLVEREGYLRPEHLGAAGSEQGRDVIAYRATNKDESLWYFQCKRYQTISAAQLIEEVQKYNDLVKADPMKKPFGVVFVTNATLSANTREKVRKFCGEHGYDCEFWARTELDLHVKKHSDIVAEFFNLTLPPLLPSNRISISRLPTTGPDLFGRDAELQRLDEAWVDPDIHIITFVAWGGVGKTAFVNHWLKQRMARDNYRGAERVYGWSFYSQGTSEHAASADLFIDQALRWFGDTDPTQGSPWDKGERLAHLVRQTRTLLVLDGLEPLQHPPGPQEGRLKDAALQALLVELAAHQPGLCVISTREWISDLVEFENSTVAQHNLNQLSPQAGAQLLRALQVKGAADELEQAATEYEGHALALTLLGSYLSDVSAGDIQRRNEIESLENDARHGRHAEQVMRVYEKWLGEGVELAVLRLLGLFDHPAEATSIAALRAAPAITGLTEPLQNLKEREWLQSVAKLRRIKLLGAASLDDPDTLDTHPLVREHFKQQLKRERPTAWREANDRLYEHLKGTVTDFPDTLAEMSSLYAALSHGCAAGKHEEAFFSVYVLRILRGDSHFSWKKLGAYGSELEALSGFFVTPWHQPVKELGAFTKAMVLSQTGLYLRALGRLQEAVRPMQAALEIATADEQWSHAARGASNLSELYLLLGELLQALKFAQQSVEMSDRSHDDFTRLHCRTTLGDVLHHSGRMTEAAAAFHAAEEIQQQHSSEFNLLYSLWGFRYCNLLLSRGELQIVKDRAARSLDFGRQYGGLLEIGLDNLTMGIVLLLEAQQTGTSNTTQAEELLQRAVNGLRQAGTMHYLPSGLLARAELYRIKGVYSQAKRDLAEALRIATRGKMSLYLADYHLESARLNLAQGDHGKAREHLATAKGMIKHMGYHRRDKEISEITLRLH
jgi:tetratricopeptide (TPR) repeat protein